jgi:transcriptional regulator with XRE-family HTH domain
MATLALQVGMMVRHHRKARGWTQHELAARAGLSIEMMNRIEGGRVTPSLRTLEGLAEVFALPVRELFGVGAFAVAGGREDGLARLVRRVSALGPDDLDWVDELVRVALARKVRSAA